MNKKDSVVQLGMLFLIKNVLVKLFFTLHVWSKEQVATLHLTPPEVMWMSLTGNE